MRGCGENLRIPGSRFIPMPTPCVVVAYVHLPRAVPARGTSHPVFPPCRIHFLPPPLRRFLRLRISSERYVVQAEFFLSMIHPRQISWRSRCSATRIQSHSSRSTGISRVHPVVEKYDRLELVRSNKAETCTVCRKYARIQSNQSLFLHGIRIVCLAWVHVE